MKHKKVYKNTQRGVIFVWFVFKIFFDLKNHCQVKIIFCDQYFELYTYYIETNVYFLKLIQEIPNIVLRLVIDKLNRKRQVFITLNYNKKNRLCQN